MHQRQHVLDLVAAHLALLEPVAGGDGGLGATPRRAPARESLGFKIPPHARIRRRFHTGGGKPHAQVVVVQLGGPARVLAVLRGQCLHGLGRQTRETADVATELIAQRLHRIGGASGGVKPALKGRDAEADLKTRVWMLPRLRRQGGKRSA